MTGKILKGEIPCILQSNENQLLSNSATAVAELETEGNVLTTIVKNSATTVAELQLCVYKLIINVGWVQNCIILEICKELKRIALKLSIYLNCQKTPWAWQPTIVTANCQRNTHSIYLLKKNWIGDCPN